MTTPPTEGVDAVALEIVEALEKAGIPVALGGAHALGVWGVPRGTADVDLSAFVEEDRYGELLDTLARAGCDVDRERAIRQARQGDAIVVRRYGWRVDVFVPTIPFHEEVRRTVRTAVLGGRRIPFVSAEALSVLKLLFFRSKDLADLEQLVAVQGSGLDHAWVRSRLVSMLGEDDERVAAWDRIVRTHGPST